jgi:hypothetical protein
MGREAAMLLLRNKVSRQIEGQDVNFGGDAASEALRIEEVMNRAHEIHRARGGMIGYDLEDWLEAERELIERNRPDHFRAEEAPLVMPSPWGSRKEL